ncbi:hypothetical protein O3G_MSEX014569 [Manduca sexta]|uniref:Uncharacterized protein n=1 Tax=Manduca sexta TaxID=7130 RepID=A0A921ZVI5_MANSE|nr:hypothetical protein O3G_MSEX014569 [Manduca sexta]
MKSDGECNSDMKSAASGMKELFSGIPNPGLDVSQLVTENVPLNLKNLFKLRDVELIPPGQLIEKLKLGQSAFQIPSLIENMPKLSDLLKNGIKFDLNKNGKWSNAKNDDKSLEDASSSTNIQVIPRDKTFTTQILDALPSTSNINELKDNFDIRQENVRNKAKPLSIIPIKTEIIESIPNSFHPEDIDHPVIDNDLDQNEKNGEDDCDLMQRVSLEDIISNPREEDQSISDTDSQEEARSRVKSDFPSQDVGASNCLEMIHDEVVSLENRDEISPKDVPNSDMKPLATVKEEDQRRIGLNHEKSSSEFNQKVSPLSHSLKSVKESILRKIDESKRTSKLTKGDILRESTIDKNTAGSEINNVGEDCDTEPSENILSMSPKTLNIDEKKLKSSKGSSNTLQLEDLQKLSDSLLRKSLLREKAAPAIVNNDCSDEIESQTDDRSVEKPLSLKDSTVDTDTASTIPHITEIKNPSDFDLLPQNNERDAIDSPCTSSTNIENTPKSLRTGIDVNEMAVEASEPVLGAIYDPLQLFKNTNLGSTLFENIVVQPSSLFEGLRNPPSLDLGTVLNLPTLDDLRERLANVFGRNNKDTDEDIDCPNENPIMSAEPSTSNFISSLPRMPLQDLNLDIFQLKPPISEKSNTLSKIPGVNLKSFRTKVPVPNNLELKPLKLQSTVGNEGGLLGASLTFGRDSTGIPKLLETLGNPPQNLPSLNEMMTRMRTNVENLVNNPLDLSRSIDSVSRIDDITNSLKSNTENTIRTIQERMGSTLGRPNNLLSTSAGKPEDILERIVDAKEDMEAKLKGLHYDLNDRLTSIHENILDHTRLSPLNSLFEGSSLSRNAFHINQLTGAERLHTPATKRLKAENKKETLGKTANLKSKAPLDRKINSIASQRKFKMPAAASVPVPKTIEAPKLKSTLNKHLSTPEHDLKSRLGSSRIKPLHSENNNLSKLPTKHFQEKGVLGKHASSLKEKKVKVTFGSTTPRTISKSQQRSKSDFDDTPTENLRRPDSGFGRRLGKQRNDLNESPSEALPTRLLSPKTSESRNCIENVNSLEDIEEKASFVKSNRGSMRETVKEQDNLKTPKIDSTRSDTKRKLTNNSPTLPFPSLPKIDDNSFLSKVREAVKARLSSFDPKIIGGREAKTCSDMERSASENHNVVVGENMKENVSYKCKMVCTKS